MPLIHRTRLAAAVAACASLAALSLAALPAGASRGSLTHPRRRPGSQVAVHVSPSDPVIAAAGNIACDPNNPAFDGGAGTKSACRMRYVSNLLLKKGGRPRYHVVLGLGDMQYICGGYTAYQRSYGKTWGRVFAQTRPTVGDKDYRTTANAPGGTNCTDPPGRAAGFFSYFGPRKPYLLTHADGGVQGSGAYYSFNIPLGCTPAPGGRCWHVIAVNGNCVKAPGCEPGTAQYEWLRSDLAEHPNSEYRCTLAFWHFPRFSSGAHGSDPTYDSLWRLLYSKGVDIVLNAHDHDYERFARQTPDGVRSADGIREFVVGTGGESHVAFPGGARIANSEASNALTFGILTLRLHIDGYDWRFIPALGGTFTDASKVPTPCH